MKNPLKAFFAMMPLLLLLSSCGFIDTYYLPVPEDTAQELFEAGADAMQEKDYYGAAAYFEKLKDRFPFSPYAIKAELGLGDAYFLNESYIESMDAYMEFETQHPRHEQIPYVLYQIGMSGYKSFSTIDRPQDQVSQGLEYFIRLKELYPDTDYAKSADEYIVKCRTILADRELFIADFYWNTNQNSGAWNRYQYVADNYSDLPEIHEYAVKKAELAYLRYIKDKTDAAQKKTHGSWKDYFGWL